MATKEESADIKISRELQDIFSKLEKEIMAVAGERMPISLFIFNPIAGSRINYASNIPRDEVIKAITFVMRSWETGMPDIAAHDIN